MTRHFPKGAGQFGGGGLELWLIRTIQQGTLKDLPPYYPMGEREGRHPEQYAQALLVGLREPCGDVRMMERTRDDGRAFRSWAETAPTSFGCPDRLRSVC